LARRGCAEDASGVGLVDITLRLGKPTTWGSDQQKDELLEGNMGSIQREVSGLYTKKGNDQS
jgi:hypothetical protein